jgi:hypothetical protein
LDSLSRCILLCLCYVIRMSGKGICWLASLAEVVDPEAVSYMN